MYSHRESLLHQLRALQKCSAEFYFLLAKILKTVGIILVYKWKDIIKIDGIGNSHTCNKNKNLYFVKYHLSYVVSFFSVLLQT